MLKAVTRQATSVDSKLRALNASRPEGTPPLSTAYWFDHHATAEDVAVTVTEEDFLKANEELVPSVSAGELRHYEKVRETFEGGRGEEKKDLEQQPVRRESVEAASGVSRPTSKGKGKAVVGKGKGKAVATSDDDDEEYEGDTSIMGNGHVNGKGKGKAVAGFQDGTASDDDGLY
jgi:peroxin-6